MAEFILECYAPRADTTGVEQRAERTRRAVEQLTREGLDVRFVRSIFVPEEETCFFLYEASSADAVREAARRSALPFAHIAEVAASGSTPELEETR